MSTARLTWIELVRQVAAEHRVKNVSDEQADFILWECTAFPFAGVDYTRQQIHTYFSRMAVGDLGDDSYWDDGG